MERFYVGVVSCLRITLSTFWYDRIANASPWECNRWNQSHDMVFLLSFSCGASTHGGTTLANGGDF